MRIKNEKVSIKVGKMQYDLHNLVLDQYLQRFASAQFIIDTPDNARISKDLEYCLLKFDTPLSFESSSTIFNQAFDVAIVFDVAKNQEISENQIIMQYLYKPTIIYDYSKSEGNHLISEYCGKKITAIGFNTNWRPSDESSTITLPVCAIVDTSNYNIYLQENQEFSVTRRDIIETDAIFYSNNREHVPCPVHLCPDRIPQIIPQPELISSDGGSAIRFNDKPYAVLYSIGLSSYTDYIDKEYIIGQDIQAVNSGTEININGLENYFEANSPLFPSNDIYPNPNLYPIKSNYKYLIFKYKIWQLVHEGTYDEYTETPTNTGYYYYQAVPIDKYGNSNIKIKYERGNTNG